MASPPNGTWMLPRYDETGDRPAYTTRRAGYLRAYHCLQVAILFGAPVPPSRIARVRSLAGVRP